MSSNPRDAARPPSGSTASSAGRRTSGAAPTSPGSKAAPPSTRRPPAGAKGSAPASGTRRPPTGARSGSSTTAAPGGARRRPSDASAPRPRSATPRPPVAEKDYVQDPPLGESSWRSFFLPVRSNKPGTMPAGTVLAVVVVALVLATFMSGNVILRKSNGRPDNAAWRNWTASAVASISDTFGIDAPTQAAEDAVAPIMGRERLTTAENNLDQLLAEQQQASGAAPTVTEPPVTEPGATVPVETTTTTIDNRPKLATPTPAAPLKMWVGGDSISYDFGIAVENIALQSKLFTVTRDSRASTGLTRPDYFNWPENLVRNVITDQDPDVIMVMFGANDAQNIPMPPPIGGYVLGSEEWRTEYRDRVGKTMDLLRSPENDRLVMWVGQPIMGPQSGVEHLDQINYIYASEAKKRPWVQYFDAFPFFSDASGAYAKALVNADGAEHVMRANDNIHLSSFGANRLAWAVMGRLGTVVDLSQSLGAPDPAQMAPPEVVERTEIPPGEGQAPYP